MIRPKADTSTKVISLVFVLFIIASTGCKNTPTPPPSALHTSITSKPTLQTPTIILTPTHQPTASPTRTPLPTSLPTPTPTLSQSPILNRNDAHSLLYWFAYMLAYGGASDFELLLENSVDYGTGFSGGRTNISESEFLSLLDERLISRPNCEGYQLVTGAKGTELWNIDKTDASLVKVRRQPKLKPERRPNVTGQIRN